MLDSINPMRGSGQSITSMIQILGGNNPLHSAMDNNTAPPEGGMQPPDETFNQSDELQEEQGPQGMQQEEQMKRMLEQMLRQKIEDLKGERQQQLQQGDREGAAQTEAQIQQKQQELDELMGGQQGGNDQGRTRNDPSSGSNGGPGSSSGAHGGPGQAHNSGSSGAGHASSGGGHRSSASGAGHTDSASGTGHTSSGGGTASGSGTSSSSGTSSAGTAAADGTTTKGEAAVDLAESKLGQASINVEMDNYTAAGGVTNDCADFVSACLANAGTLDKVSSDCNVTQLTNHLKEQGWTVVSREDAQAGDVAVVNGNQHVELVATDGATQCIGSNGSSSQSIKTDDLSWADSVVYYSSAENDEAATA